MKIVKNTIVFILALMMPLVMQAQQVDMADDFRKDGKIYVVVAVAAVILSGIFVYLFMLDNKVSKIEKQVNKTSK